MVATQKVLKPKDVRPSIEALTTLFAALVGFGLIRLLQRPFDALGHWPFLVALLLFLRFLTGSRNHLWHEHGDPDQEAVSPFLLQVDLLFLLGFGVFAAFMCYSRTPSDFVFWGAVMLGAALGWGILDQVAQFLAPEKRRHGGTWKLWMVMDLIHLVLFAGLGLAIDWWARVGGSPVALGGDGLPPVWAWRGVAILNLVMLVVDFSFQLSVLREQEPIVTDTDVHLFRGAENRTEDVREHRKEMTVEHGKDAVQRLVWSQYLPGPKVTLVAVVGDDWRRFMNGKTGWEEISKDTSDVLGAAVAPAG